MPTQTPSQTVGPFFHYGLLFGGENNLVKDQTAGERILLTGQVLDGDGQPVPDAMLEIWQADAQGYFNHPADPNQAQADPHFGGFGRTDTVNEGRYQFKTIKPGAIQAAYAPYINVRVFSRGMLIHAVTRIYFSDEAANQSDPLLTSLAPERAATLIAQRIDSADLPTYRLNVALQGASETVFFDV